MKLLLAAMLAASAATVHAAPLTIPVGETWVFTVRNGEPANAHKVAFSAKPTKGQLMISVRWLFGTNMIVRNNSPIAYTFRAELLSNGKTTATRPCDLPANGKPILEQWPQRADAVRISQFRTAAKQGRC